MTKKIFIFITIIVLLVGLVDMQRDNGKVVCSELPFVEEVQKVITEHQDIIKELESLSNTSSIWFSIDTERCSGKADILIYHGTESQCEQIKEKIGKNFFGIPYRMFNV